MKNKNQTVFEDSDEETSIKQTNGKNGSAKGNDQQTGDFKNFDLSKKTLKKLKARNIEYLYPVQSKTYTSIYEQNDCLIQASSGSGKTLAYALPLVELLQSDKTFELADGRSARVLVLSSTKDTAKQVSDEFQTIVNDLSVVAVFAAKKKSDEQETAIANGVDVLVATPDRLKELIDNEKVDLSSVNHVVLDDVDQMLESETSENVKKVLKQTFSSDRENKAQLVVLSQTSPDSFRKLIKKYLSDEAVTVNLADDESDEGFDESVNNTSANGSSKAENGSVSLLTKKENYTTYQLTTNEEIKSVGFVYAIIRKCLGDTFDAKSSVPQVAFTKDFTSAVFDLPSEHDEQLQNAWKDTNRTQLATITELPEIDQASITDNTGYSRGGGGAGGNRNSGKSNGCFKCGKEGHKSFECTEGGGGFQRGGGNRAGGNGCFNCGKDGHKSFECTEPKKAGGGGAGGRSNGCFNCGQDGHKSFECTEPKKAGGGGGAGGGCFNCGKDGHKSFECTEPKKAGGGGGAGGGCFNCGKDGHKSFECPEPKKGRPSAGGGARGGRGGARGGGAKRSFGGGFGGGFENGNSAGEATNKKIKFDDDDE